MDNYFVQIKSYFGQTKYDQMIQGFMRASSLYMDTIRLAEWHIYGSSRIGIYQANLHMASRSVRVESGTETQVNSTTVTLQSYTYFTTERGSKRFELTNHLGNVLAVITDKKVAICSTEVFAYWKAELVSATDYAPFGAPLSERIYQGNEYRFGFNGQEKDDELAGVGNTMTAEFWEYDARLGRRWNLDPVVFSCLSGFAVFNNNPNIFVDPLGLKPGFPEKPKDGDRYKHKQAETGNVHYYVYHSDTKAWEFDGNKPNLIERLSTMVVKFSQWTGGIFNRATESTGSFFSNQWRKIDNYMHDDDWNTPKPSPIKKVELFGQIKFEVNRFQINGKAGFNSVTETDINGYAKGDISTIAMAQNKPKKWELKGALKVTFKSEEFMVIQQKIPLGFLYLQINVNPINSNWQSIELGITPEKKSIKQDIETPTGKIEIEKIENQW